MRKDGGCDVCFTADGQCAGWQGRDNCKEDNREQSEELKEGREKKLDVITSRAIKF